MEIEIEDLIDKLTEAVNGIEPGEARPETALADLPAWDSLALLSAIVMVDSEYGLTVTGNEVAGCSTVRDLHALVCAKASAAAAGGAA